MHGPSSPSRRRAVAALLAVAGTVGALGATACGSVRGRGAAVPRTTITFVNQSQDLARVYVVSGGGEPFRIGNVPAGRTETLNVPRAAFASGQMVHFLARPLAGSRFVQSGAISLGPGDRITVTLPPAANLLSVLPSQ